MSQITLKAARINANLTQKAASEKIGVSESTLKKWENGTAFPRQPQIMRICETYNVEYDQIFFTSKLA